MIAFLFVITFVAHNAIAQFQINRIKVFSNGVLSSNTYNKTDPLSYPCSQPSNPVNTYINIDVQVNKTLNGAEFNYDEYDTASPSYNFHLHVSFMLNFTNSIIEAFNATETDVSTFGGIPPIQTEGSLINFSSAPFSYSNNYDTLKVSLDGFSMRKINLLETNYSECFANSRDNYKFLACSVDSILYGASLSVIIIGKFPLSVAVSLNNPLKLIIDPVSKTLKIFKNVSNQTQPLPCYDLLGRNHNLEFLGPDGTASTYSVRSLRPGVYFVSDGSEMVKFMIGE